MVPVAIIEIITSGQIIPFPYDINAIVQMKREFLVRGERTVVEDAHIIPAGAVFDPGLDGSGVIALGQTVIGTGDPVVITCKVQCDLLGMGHGGQEGGQEED